MTAFAGHIRRQDWALALTTAALQLGVAALANSHGHRTLPAWAVLLLAAGPAALLVRRRHPSAVLVTTFAAALAYSAANGYPRGVVFPALVVAFWAAMMSGRRRLGWLSLLAGYAVFVAALPLAGLQPTASALWASGIAGWMLLLAAAAEIVRVRRERGREAARALTEQSRRVAGEERMRIARELHDVLAHNISLINVQASVALHLVDERPEQSRAALSAIKEASADMLGELRSVLDALRAPEDRAPRAPAAGLDRLDQLLARATSAGVPISSHIDRSPRQLPAGVDLAAYRIIQEALTNVTRHAPGARVEVRVSYTEHQLVLEVANEASAGNVTASRSNGSSGGNGIAECANARTRSAASSRLGAATREASMSAPRCPSRRRDDPGPARRRSGARPRRLPGPARRPG
jgi:signal transduction histidine kinase